ncbi:MAG: hypothetical protein AMXMBFR47_40640 [Planctomycetota bacterium]
MRTCIMGASGVGSGGKGSDWWHAFAVRRVSMPAAHRPCEIRSHHASDGRVPCPLNPGEKPRLPATAAPTNISTPAVYFRPDIGPVPIETARRDDGRLFCS